MNPFFSIILPTYNRGYILERTIESVINQQFQDWELLIVDDGSKDNTSEIVNTYMIHEKRINYLYQENAERSAARNNGISKANGKFICFLDSDDQFEPNHLQSLFETINSNGQNTFIYITGSRIVNINGSLLNVSKITPGKNDAETILLNTITPGQMCIPISLIRKHLFNVDIRISEDTEILFRLISDSCLKLTNHASLLYVHHDDNSVNPLRYNAYKERKETLKLIFSKPIGKKVSSILKRKVLNDCYFGIAKFYAANERFWIVRWNMLKALIIYPEYRWKEKIYLILHPQKAV
jgi:glycosyltransferase involved in cell wall biosynthesis